MEIKDRSLVQLLPGQGRKRLALALAFAGMYCCSAGTVMADDNLIITDGFNGPYINDGGTHDVNGYLILGDQAGDTGTYTITGETEQTNITNVNFIDGGNGGNPNGALIIGNAGTGIFTQGIGEAGIGVNPYHDVNVAGDLVLGSQAGSQGQYTLNTTSSLTVGGKIVVGGASTEDNLFTQNGGTVTITGSASGDPNYVGVGNSTHAGALYIGGGADAILDGGTGTYVMNDGELNAFMIEVGHAGLGVMTQNGGTVNGSIWLGNVGGSDGSYTLIDGVVNSPWSIGIGLDGTGTFTQEGGIVNSASVTIGWNNTGTYTQNAGDHNSHEVLLGTDVGGNGSYNLNDGTLTIQDGVTDRLVVGHNSQGTFSMTGGTLNINNNDINTAAFIVGNNAEAEGTFTQSGGVVNGGRSLTIAYNGGTGTYNLNTDSVNGTTPELHTGFISLGYSGTGTFNQQEGSLNDTGSLFIGADHGIYNQYGGDLNVGGQGTIVGTFGVGEFNQSGGTHTTEALSLGQHAGSSGTYNLTGGDLIVHGQMIIGHGDTSFSTGLNGLFTQSESISASTVQADQIIIGGGIIDSEGNGNLGTGRYELSDGTVTANSTTVGNLSQGSVLQTGGTFNAGTLTLGSAGLFSTDDGAGGYNFFSSGIYDLEGGTLNTNGTTVAMFGLGTFNQSGTSTHDVSGNLVIGAGPGVPEPLSGQIREGIYTLSGGVNTLLHVTGDTIIGAGNNDFAGEPGGKGTFIQSGGTHTVEGSLILGQGGTEGNGTGLYELSGGELDVSGVTYVGEKGNGVFNLGTVTPGDPLTYTGDGTHTTNELYVGYNTGTDLSVKGVYNLYAGTLQVNGFTVIGGKDGGSAVGIGEFNQWGGTYTTGGLFLGDTTGSLGTYNLHDGQLNGGMWNVIGANGGVGIFNQSGGTYTAAGTLEVGGSGTGSYHLDDGTLNTDNTIVGNWGPGTFTQDGGTHEVTSDLTLGANSGITGTYTLNNGDLNVAGWARIGNEGTGIFNQSGGNFNLTGGSADLYLGFSADSYGEYNLTNGNLNVGWMYVGGEYGTGVVNQSGGRVTLEHDNGEMNVGTQSGSEGTYNLSGSGILDASQVTLYIGRSAGSTGTFNQTGGTLTADWMDVGSAGKGDFIQSGGTAKVTNNLVIGREFGSDGSYALSGSDLVTLDTGETHVGIYEEATFTQDGGIHRAGSLVLGYNNDTDGKGIGNYELKSGSLFSDYQRIGLFGEGNFTQTGGKNTVTETLVLGQEGAAKGTYTLESGDLLTNAVIVGGSGTSEFIQTGGSHTATAWLTVGDNLTGSGTYNLSGNGSLSVGTTVNAYNLMVGYQGDGLFTQADLSSVVVHGALILGGEAGGYGKYDMSGGTLDANFIQVGRSGNGDFVQTGGMVTVTEGSANHGGVNLGQALGTKGTYTLSDDGVLNAKSIGVGLSGTGIFTQEIGTQVLVTDNLVLGYDVSGTGNGTYYLKDGTLDVGGYTTVGLNGTGTFIQEGGIHTAFTLTVGRYANPSSKYELKGGSLVTDRTGIGIDGSGIFTQTGGIHTTDALFLGREASGNGTYYLESGTLVSHATIVGDLGTGDFQQTGGSNTVYGNMILGKETTGDGTYTLSGSASTLDVIYNGDPDTYASGNIIIGHNGKGTFTQNDGTVTANELMLGGGPYAIQPATYSDGKYLLENGNLKTVREAIGRDGGTGLFTQNGGTNTATGWLEVGMYRGSDGTYNLNSGKLNTGLLAADDSGMIVGNSGKGTLNQFVDTTVTTNRLYVGMGWASGADGAAEGNYNMSGGILTDQKVVIGGFNGGKGVFNQTGGEHTVGTSATSATNYLDIGNHGTSGAYKLSGASSVLTVYGEEWVGSGTLGTFDQAGGTHTVNGKLIVGEVATGNGIFNLSGASSLLTVNGQESIGKYGIGEFNQTGGLHTVDGGLYLAEYKDSQGTFNLSGGTLKVTGDLNVGTAGSQGTFNNKVGGTAEVTGDMNIASGSRANLSGGSLSVNSLQNAGMFDFTGGTFEAVATSNNSGTLKIGESVIFKGDITNMFGGTLQGNGTVQGDVVNLGILAPGTSPGTFTIVGDYTQNADGRLAIEINGDGQGTGYDFLNIVGIAQLAGYLDLSITKTSFYLGESFDIIHASAGLSGYFTSFDNLLPTLGTGLKWGWDYSTYDFKLFVMTDGGSAPVPEPATMLLFGAGLAGLAAVGRRKRS